MPFGIEVNQTVGQYVDTKQGVSLPPYRGYSNTAVHLWLDEWVRLCVSVSVMLCLVDTIQTKV